MKEEVKKYSKPLIQCRDGLQKLVDAEKAQTQKHSYNLIVYYIIDRSINMLFQFQFGEMSEADEILKMVEKCAHVRESFQKAKDGGVF